MLWPPKKSIDIGVVAGQFSGWSPADRLSLFEAAAYDGRPPILRSVARSWPLFEAAVRVRQMGRHTAARQRAPAHGLSLRGCCARSPDGASHCCTPACDGRPPVLGMVARSFSGAYASLLVWGFRCFFHGVSGGFRGFPGAHASLPARMCCRKT